MDFTDKTCNKIMPNTSAILRPRRDELNELECCTNLDLCLKGIGTPSKLIMYSACVWTDTVLEQVLERVSK